MPIRGKASVLLCAIPRTARALLVNAHHAKEGVWRRSRRMKRVLRSAYMKKFNSHEVSASSSFLRFILSFRPSASRRAAAIFACICSPDISDIADSDYADERDVFAV